MKCLFLFLISFATYADDFNIDLMANYQAANYYRGAQIWPKGSIMVAPGILLYDRKLKIYGPNVFYSFFPDVDNTFQLDAGVNYFDDNKPLLSLAKHQADYRNQRRNSLESFSTFAYKFGYRKKFSVGITLAKEFIEHHGVYSEFKVTTPFLPLSSLVGVLSVAEKKTNQYIYGAEAISNTGFALLGINIIIPFVPWDGIIMNQFNYSWILKDENRNSDYVRGNDPHWNFTTRWIWKVF